MPRRGSAAAGGPRGSPRLDIVLRLWQCDKENHGWREGPPLTVLAKVSISWMGLHPPAKSVSNEKRILHLSLTRSGSVKTAGWAFIRPGALSFVKMRTWTKPQFLTTPSSCCGRASGSRSQFSSDAWLSLALGCGRFLAATLVPSGGYVRCSLGWGLRSSPYRLCRGRPI